jgi:homoaconitate hydratase family protein
MGMTMAEKILARHAGETKVQAGQFVTAKVDWLQALDNIFSFYNDVKEIGIKEVWDPTRIVVDCSHQNPPSDIRAAERYAINRKFVEDFGIIHWDEVGRSGIGHQTFPEKGFALPGSLIAGVDSHTTTYGAFNAASTAIQGVEACYLAAKGEIWFRVPETIRFEISGELPPMVMGKDLILKIAGDYGTDIGLYKSVEFVGAAVEKMSLSARWTIANMGIEIGAKFAMFEADEKTFEYLRGRTAESFTPVDSDADAAFEKTYQLNANDLEPQVACPHEVGNVKPVSQVKGVAIQQAFLGSCTGGRMEDLVVAAEMIKGKKVFPKVRLIVIPASVEIYKEALQTGVLATLIDAGAFVCGPSCGPCGGAGGHMGILAAGERCISATNRNWKGRMGSPESEVYLASPATVAASAIAGVITDPRDWR